VKALTRDLVVAVSAVVAGGMLGCGDAPPPASIPNPEASSSMEDDTMTKKERAAEDVQQNVKDAVDAAGKYADQTKIEYQQAMQDRLAELDAKIESLKEKAETASQDANDDARKKYEEAMAALKEKRDVMQDEFGQLKDASSDAWHEIASGVDSAWTELSDAFSNASEHFEEPE